MNFFMSGGESPAVRPTDVAATIRAPNLLDHRILSLFKVLPLGFLSLGHYWCPLTQNSLCSIIVVGLFIVPVAVGAEKFLELVHKSGTSSKLFSKISFFGII